MEHIRPTFVHILMQINTVHNFHSIFPVVNVIIPSTIKPSNWPLPCSFSYQNFNAMPPSLKHATCPTHITILNLIILILQCRFPWAPVVSPQHVREHPRSIFFPQQEILKFHTQNMSQKKLYFIHLHFHLVRCKQEK
jgi:hypothetical protein